MTLYAGHCVCQGQTNAQHSDNFYFYYGVAGLGSNMGSFQPTLRIHNKKFTYTKEQNSYWGKRSKKVTFICKGSLRQSSIDSILSLVERLKDTTIYKTNPCIMSGAITYMIIAQGSDTTKFTLDNTLDSTSLKIVNLLNPYLPKNKKLYGSEDDIRQEEQCWTYLRERVKQRSKDNTNVKK